MKAETPFIIKDCLLHDSQALQKASEKLDKESCDNALLALNYTFDKNGKLLLTGVGKSGIVARKIAATFTSLGYPALFLNPTDALHGDIGIARENDTVIIISNSGETSEIVSLLPYLTKKLGRIIAITSDSSSTVSKFCHVHLECSIDRESCPLNLAPTTSTTLSLAMGDALAAQWSIERGITNENFAVNHPAGILGKRLTLTVEDIMIEYHELPKVTNTSNLRSIILSMTSELENKRSVGFTLVTNNSSLIGIITEGDLRRALSFDISGDWDNIIAENICTKNPKIIDRKSTLIDALQKMENNKPGAISCLGVTCEREIIGFVTMRDIVSMNN